MCKILRVVYFSLFLVNIVKPNDVQEDGPPIEKVKIPKHRHHKTRTTLNDVIKKIKNDDAASNPNTTEEPKGIIVETNTENLLTGDNSVNLEELAPESTTEANFGRSANTPETLSLGSLEKTLLVAADESADNDSDSHDLDREKSKTGNIDDTNDDEQNNDIEVLKTPVRITLSQDPVLDLKARSGRLEGDDSDTNSNKPDGSKKDHLSPLNTNLRSGYIPSDETNVFKSPGYVQNYAQHFNHPIPPRSDPHPYQYTTKPRPEMPYNTFLNYQPRYSPLYFENISSRETMYPMLNGLENWALGNSGHQLKPYFVSYHNNLMYNRCPKCAQATFQSPEHSWRRATDKSSDVETTKGRSVDFDSSSANAYPLVQDTAADEIPRVQSQISSNFNELNPGSRETHASQEVERTFKVPNAQPDPSSLTKLLLTLPSYIPLNSSALLRRLGLGSQRYVM